MQNWLRGDMLAPRVQIEALKRFRNRYTGTHLPAWVKGTKLPLQFADDVDWLCNTFFMVRVNGELDNRAQWCESHPTWPNNPELRKKFGAGAIGDKRR